MVALSGSCFGDAIACGIAIVIVWLAYAYLGRHGWRQRFLSLERRSCPRCGSPFALDARGRFVDAISESPNGVKSITCSNCGQTCRWE